MSRVRFLTFLRKRVKMSAAADIWKGADILTGRASTAETPPI
ncbi:MAG: hypothetical protein ACK55Z_30230 [bacterium]